MLLDNYVNIPEYYPTMYMDGYTPEQILMSARKSMRAEPQTNVNITVTYGGDHGTR